MSSQLSEKDREKIDSGIREKYHKVAISPEGQFDYPTGIEGLKKLGYDNHLIADLPNIVADSFCGVGNPFSLGKIDSGAFVLDIGCGSGVDALIAAKLVGPSGKVLGIDVTTEMIEKANYNKELMASDNISFQVASVQDIADVDEGFDVIISNGVFNLIPDKDEALQAAYGLLKPGGKLYICDQILTGPLSKDVRQRVASWFQWEGGAIPGMDFLAMLNKAGFEKAELAGETGCNSSPKTKGVLFRAEKPKMPAKRQQFAEDPEHGNEMVHSILRKGTIPSVESVLEKAYAMGCEKAKIIDTSTVIIEKWTRWKCLYGCPFYNKDGYHPPFAPSVEETKEVLGEYTKAILLNGPKGKALTDIAVRLEGEAYKMGYYKAFALTALPSGAGGETKPGATWPSGEEGGPCDTQKPEEAKNKIRPMMEACGIDVFRTARNNGFEIDTQRETFGRWNYFALLLVV